MPTKKPSKPRKQTAPSRTIHTGGGAYVERMKGKKIVMRDEINLAPSAPADALAARDALIAVLRDLHERVEALELEAWQKEEIAGNLKTAEKMIEAKTPPSDKLLDKLTTTQKLLEAAKGAVEAAKGVGAAVGIGGLASKAGELLQAAQHWLSLLPR